MIRVLPAAILAGLVALPASAVPVEVIRVEVTGSLGWSYVYESAVDLGTDQFLPGGVLLPGDVPPGTPGFDYRDLAATTKGSFLYSRYDRIISECTGLMTMICRFSAEDPRVLALPPTAFDVVLDTFDASLVIMPDVASFTIDPSSFLYDTDYVSPNPRIGTITYFRASPRFRGTIDSMTVTTVIPLPAGLPLMLAGLGALALHRRRAKVDPASPAIATAP